MSPGVCPETGSLRMIIELHITQPCLNLEHELKFLIYSPALTIDSM